MEPTYPDNESEFSRRYLSDAMNLSSILSPRPSFDDDPLKHFFNLLSKLNFKECNKILNNSSIAEKMKAEGIAEKATLKF